MKRKPFKETKVGKWLADNAGGVLDIADDYFPPAKIITALVKGKIDPEKEAELNALLLEYEQTERRDYLADVANSREANARIQESANASWLAKNVSYIFDSVMIWSFVVILFMIFTRQVPETNKEIFYTGFGLLGSYVGQIMGFHRGTSKGSEDKQKALEKQLHTK